jgi:integrase/recombinase XerD
MFQKIIKRSYYRQRHLDAPLLNERIKYIQHWADKGRSLSTLQAVANYLLRIVEFLHLKSRRVVKLKEVENAANAWASYQYNHPQKRAEFSKCGKERFTWYAIDWLKNLKWLEPLPEEKIPLFNRVFERRKALQRHINAPLLEERLMYLQKWADDGATLNTLRFIAHYLLAIIDFLKLHKKKVITLKEIQKAANKWATRTTGHIYMKVGFSKGSMMRFKSVAINWLDILGRLKHPKEKVDPFSEFIDKYVDYMRKERGLSEETIYARIWLLKDFFRSIGRIVSLQQIAALNIDDVLKNKYLEGQSRRSLQTYASVLRGFFTYAEGKKWCQKGLASSIKTSRVYRHENLPQGPSWDDVSKLLEGTEGDHPTNIRDRAIIMLLAVYGLRCGEVVQLSLDDLDWGNEVLYVRRVKNAKSQKFPFSQTVGDTILRYLQKVRPNNCPCREVFISRKAPHRPLTSAAIFQIVSKRLKPLKINLKHHGPHTLRHACATRLINEGISLKEISDHLGHRSLESTRIYAKVDLFHLRKIADFEIGDLI